MNLQWLLQKWRGLAPTFSKVGGRSPPLPPLLLPLCIVYVLFTEPFSSWITLRSIDIIMTPRGYIFTAQYNYVGASINIIIVVNQSLKFVFSKINSYGSVIAKGKTLEMYCYWFQAHCLLAHSRLWCVHVGSPQDLCECLRVIIT